MAKKRKLRVNDALDKRVALMLRFVRFTNLFKIQERLIWYKGNDNRELDGEHVFQLVIFAWFIRDRFLPHLNLLKVLLYAIVHDLPETYGGDTPAFQDKSGKHKSKATAKDKKEREAEAIKRIEAEWDADFPEMLNYLHAYEKLEDEESRFVYALDKFLAELNVYEDDGRTDKILCLTRDEIEEYKRPRIAEHDFLYELYDDFCKFVRLRPEIHFNPEEKFTE